MNFYKLEIRRLCKNLKKFSKNPVSVNIIFGLFEKMGLDVFSMLQGFNNSNFFQMNLLEQSKYLKNPQNPDAA